MTGAACRSEVVAVNYKHHVFTVVKKIENKIANQDICLKFVDISLNCFVMKNIENRLDKEIANLLKMYTVQAAPSSASKALKEPEQNFTYADFLSDKMLIIKAIGLGVPYSLFELIKEYTSINENDWASILDVSTKTLQRYKLSNAHFKALQSQKIIEMSEVTKLGIDIFGNIDTFKLWLETPNFALGNVRPKDLLKDSYGKEMLMGELTRIDYGIFA